MHHKVQNASWHSENIIPNTKYLKDDFAPLNLVIFSTTNQGFIKRITNKKNIQEKEQEGNEQNKNSKKTGKLYYRGDILTQQSQSM